MAFLDEIKKEAERLRPGTLPVMPEPIYKEEPRKLFGIIPFGKKKVVEEVPLLQQLKERAEKLRPTEIKPLKIEPIEEKPLTPTEEYL